MEYAPRCQPHRSNRFPGRSLLLQVAARLQHSLRTRWLFQTSIRCEMATANVTRFTRQLLKRNRKEPPSLVLHLYPTHFRFEQQHGNFNYDSPMKCFLEAIREQKIPTDLLDVLDQANVRFYEGCLIVEVHDHRSLPPPVTLASALASTSTSSTSTARYPRQQLSFALANMRDQPNMAKAEVYRIVLSQNPATLWTDLAIQNERWIEKEVAELQGDGPNDTDDIVRPPGWTEEETVELESIILLRTMAPLCLSPSIQATRVSNTMLRATTLRPPKRKRFCHTEDADEEGGESEKREREEREKLMKIGDEGISRARGTAFARLAFIQAYRERQANPPTIAPPAPPAAPAANSSVTSIRLTVNNPATGSRAVVPSTSHDDTRKRTKKKKISTGAATESDGTPGPPTTKRIKKSTHVISAADAADESFDKERAAAERKRVAGQKKRAELKASKEKKKKGDYMGPSSSKYSWAS